MKTNLNVIVADEAAEIGDLYWKAKQSYVGTVNYLLEAGQKLKQQKKRVGHGNWLKWLQINETTLGFGDSTAGKLMTAATKFPVNGEYGEKEALAILRFLWGNTKDSQLIQQSESNEHYTPQQYIDAARAVLGEIDLDPASCAEANQIVNAKEFFDEKSDGLNQRWYGRIWLNPPYGDLVGKFISKLMSSSIEAAIVLVNAHCTDTQWFKPLWDGVLCFTDHRVNFYGDEARSGSTHGSVFVYFGANKDKFASEFVQFGAVVGRYGNK